MVTAPTFSNCVGDHLNVNSKILQYCVVVIDSDGSSLLWTWKRENISSRHLRVPQGAKPQTYLGFGPWGLGQLLFAIRLTRCMPFGHYLTTTMFCLTKIAKLCVRLDVWHFAISQRHPFITEWLIFWMPINMGIEGPLGAILIADCFRDREGTQAWPGPTMTIRWAWRMAPSAKKPRASRTRVSFRVHNPEGSSK